VTVDPEAREIWRDGGLVVLTPQVFDCIAYLVARRERAVGRDELVAAIWGRVEIADTLLHQTMMKARRVFGDSGEDQQVVRTVPRFGYRWIAAVEDDDGADRPAAAAAPAAHPDASIRTAAATRRWRFALAGVALVTVIAAVALVAGRGSRVPVAAGQAPARAGLPAHAAPAQDAAAGIANALVVLPVATSSDHDSAWIPLGVMDAIASHLRAGGVAVVPSRTVVALLGGGAHRFGLSQWREAVGASGIVHASANLRQGVWQVQLALEQGDATTLHAQARSPDVLAGAREASAQLLLQLDRAGPVADVATNGDVAALLQRARADVLADRLDAARTLLDAAPAALRADPELRLARAGIDYRSGRLDAARAAFMQLLGELPAESQPRLRAEALVALASIERTAAHFDAAERGYAEAIGLLDTLDQPLLAGRAHLQRGAALGSLRRFDEAEREIARGRVLLAAAADAHGVATADAALATLNADRGRLAVASPALARAIARLEQVGAHGEALDLRIALAQMDSERLAHDVALDEATRVWQGISATPDRRLYLVAATVYAGALADVGRLAEADRVIGAHVGDADDAGDYRVRYAHRVAMRIALAQRQAGQAERLAASVAGDADYLAHADLGPLLLGWLRALRTQGRSADIAALWPRIERWSARWQDDASDARVYVPLIRAEQAWAERRLPESYRDYRQALAAASDLGVPANVAVVVAAFGNALITDGALADAAAVVGQVATWAASDFNSALVTARLHRALGQRAAWEDAMGQVRRLAGERPVPQRLTRFAAPESASGDWLKAD
jgi:DNA-binding winged helix-turn-helix (wHTH) protein